MKVFFSGDRVIHENGQYGTVIGTYGVYTIEVPIKLDDGTSSTVKTRYITKCKD